MPRPDRISITDAAEILGCDRTTLSKRATARRLPRRYENRGEGGGGARERVFTPAELERLRALPRGWQRGRPRKRPER